MVLKFFVLLHRIRACLCEGICLLCEALCLPPWVVVVVLSWSWDFSMVARSQLVVCDLRAQGGVL